MGSFVSLLLFFSIRSCHKIPDLYRVPFDAPSAGGTRLSVSQSILISLIVGTSWLVPAKPIIYNRYIDSGPEQIVLSSGMPTVAKYDWSWMSRQWILSDPSETCREERDSLPVATGADFYDEVNLGKPRQAKLACIWWAVMWIGMWQTLLDLHEGASFEDHRLIPFGDILFPSSQGYWSI